MPWTDLLDAGRIVVLDDAGTRAQVLDAAARLLCGDAPSAQAHALSEALQEREALASTAIGHGVAIPHARGEGLEVRAAFLRLARPVDFGARDGAPVDLVFAMTANHDRPELHLEHLAGVAAGLSDPDLRERLRAARTPAQLRALLLPRAAAAHAA
ncbi:PTS sugar transporter subunit IIA [Luteimonas composti]|uniref:PTS sugar transporter subunit IIA n=1 Tax=Luteimonas composti TaxID=398257 RepID=A0ABT6MTA3_9GAMM|nr:PTS sugar transporter subunit IIA [Luteimonas composti]MDH7453861.1 PTS sugar transporter subunit IIA [Luteimonas composti]